MSGVSTVLNADETRRIIDGFVRDELVQADPKSITVTDMLDSDGLDAVRVVVETSATVSAAENSILNSILAQRFRELGDDRLIALFVYPKNGYDDEMLRSAVERLGA